MIQYSAVMGYNHSDAVTLWRQMGLDIERPIYTHKTNSLDFFDQEFKGYLMSLRLGLLNYHYSVTTYFFLDYVVIEVYNRPNEEISLILFITKVE